MPPVHVVRLPEHAAEQQPRRPPTTPRASRSACTRTTAAANFTPDQPALDVRQRPGRLGSEVHEPPVTGVEPVPLPGVERLGQPVRGRARERHPVRRQLLLLAGQLGQRPARVHDRIGHAAAVRQARRHDGRRVPGADADDRRVRPELPVHAEHAARPGAREPTATTATSSPTCTPISRRRSRTPRCCRRPVARGVPVVSARDVLRVHRRTQPVVVPEPDVERRHARRFGIAVGTGATNLTAMVPTAGPGGTVLDAIQRGATTVTVPADDDQGHRVRVVPGRCRIAHRDLCRARRRTAGAGAVDDGRLRRDGHGVLLDRRAVDEPDRLRYDADAARLRGRAGRRRRRARAHDHRSRAGARRTSTVWSPRAPMAAGRVATARRGSGAARDACSRPRRSHHRRPVTRASCRRHRPRDVEHLGAGGLDRAVRPASGRAHAGGLRRIPA